MKITGKNWKDAKVFIGGVEIKGIIWVEFKPKIILPYDLYMKCINYNESYERN
jgi:hypothetical protein